MITSFWWGSSNSGNKLHWINWKSLCKNKATGGIGFRKIVVFNQALLAKQGWRLLCDQNYLVARVLKGKYFKNSSFRAGWRPSFVWRSILWGRDLLCKGIRWRLYSGSIMRTRGFLFRLPSDPFTRNLGNNAKVEDIILGSGGWDRGKISKIFFLLRLILS